MKWIRTVVLSLVVLALASSALARRLTVYVGYGNNGSQGNYICYLYQNGYLYDIRQVQNTGLASGRADFDVPTRNYYSAFVQCTTNNTYAFSNGDWFQWFNLYMNLYAQFR